jgi:hypothetical protein
MPNKKRTFWRLVSRLLTFEANNRAIVRFSWGSLLARVYLHGNRLRLLRRGRRRRRR